METLVINIPDKKKALVKKLLKELGVTISKNQPKKSKSPNALTAKTIDDARNGIGLEGPVHNISDFLKSI
jgi:antitoxin component of RelBE/YafQ-DinJ toxin-antitoxin module